ncbi:MAG: hypothetical protein D6773_05340 [Alphaproteobacteria bacterium]|nr:MAG: hypothetical protein D6773_05340 [Alphaproteobacteria bacterium]
MSEDKGVSVLSGLAVRISEAARVRRRALRLRGSLGQRLAKGAPAECVAAIVADCPQSVVAFDVFDTLVKRSVAPEHVKILAADRLARRLGLSQVDGLELYGMRQAIEAELCRQNLDDEGEAEFRFADLAARLHALLVDREPVLAPLPVDGFHEQMLAIEVTVEHDVLTPIAAMRRALAAARDAGKRIVLLSDFYLSRPALEALLAPLGLLDGIESLQVSCDHMASKRSGRLYDLVLEELGLAPCDMLMIGDNPFADGQTARERGIETLLLDCTDQRNFYRSPAASVTSARHWESAVGLALSSSPLGPERNFRPLAPVLLLFIERLHRELCAGGHTHVAFLACEGQPLRYMFELYQDELGLKGDDRITSHYLIASRRSTYIASLAPLDEEDFADLLLLYRCISVHDFLQSLGFHAEVAGEIAREAGLALDKVMDIAAPGGAIERLRGSPAFRKAYEQRRIDQRTLLRDYVNGLGIPLKTHPLVLVDVGWKGSIQDFLSRALSPPLGTMGCYLGLMSIGQSLKGKKGLVFDNTGANSHFLPLYNENRSLFEIVLSADHASALAYGPSADGAARPLLDEDRPEQEWIRKQVLPIRDDVLEVFAELLALRRRHVVRERHWERLSARAFARLVHAPWRPPGRWLAQACHGENFGVFRTTRFRESATLPTLDERLRFLTALATRPRRTIGRLLWPAEVIHRHLGRLPAFAYGVYRRIQVGL